MQVHQPFEMNSIVHTYRSNCHSVSVPPGFGDFIRGSISLHNLSQKFKFNLIVDFSNHPLGKYLYNPGFNYSPINNNDTVMEFFNDKRDLVDNFIKAHIESTLHPSVLFLTSHKFPPEIISRETRQYMKDVLIPTKYSKNKFDFVKESIGVKPNYSVLHIRTGDHNGWDAIIENTIINFIENKIIAEWGSNVIVISDNINTKRLLASRFGFTSTHFTPIHTGSVKDFSNGNATDESVLGTFIEYLLMSESRKIYSYSCYPWKSGFSHSCSLIYDIPFEAI